MLADLTRKDSFAYAITRISALPTDKRVDALLEYFEATLDGMDSRTIRTLRDKVMERFATCGSSFATCTLMIELIDIHLALRESPRGEQAM